MSGNRAGGLKASQTNKAKDKDFYKKIGFLGGSAHDGQKQSRTVIEKYGNDWFAEIGRKGGKARAKKDKLFGIFKITKIK